VLRVIREMLYFSPRGRGTRIGTTLDALNGVLHKRSVVFLISDFLDEGYGRSLRVTNRRHDLVAVSLTDPLEESLPRVGLIDVEDPETGERYVVDSDQARVRGLFERVGRDARARRARQFRKAGVDSIEVRTDEPYDRAIVKFMAERAKRIRR